MAMERNGYSIVPCLSYMSVMLVSLSFSELLRRPVPSSCGMPTRSYASWVSSCQNTEVRSDISSWGTDYQELQRC